MFISFGLFLSAGFVKTAVLSKTKYCRVNRLKRQLIAVAPKQPYPWGLFYKAHYNCNEQILA